MGHFFTPAKSIDEVITRLETIARSCAETGNLHGSFAVVYLGVTKQVKAGILENRFDDGPRMERLDVIFANRYLDAFERHQKKIPCTQAWQTAFNAASSSDFIILQHLLMGMNAHINLDLGVAAAEVGKQGGLHLLEADFFKINQFLVQQIEHMQDKLARVSPLLFLLDWFGQKSDEKFAEFSLKKARSHAWSVAQRLSKLTPDEKPIAITELDGYVTVLNRLITEPGMFSKAILKFVRWFDTKDTGKVLDALA